MALFCNLTHLLTMVDYGRLRQLNLRTPTRSQAFFTFRFCLQVVPTPGAVKPGVEKEGEWVWGWPRLANPETCIHQK